MHLPGITQVPKKAVVRTHPAARKTKGWLLRRETLSIAQSNVGDRVVQRIRCSARKNIERRRGTWRPDRWRQSEEFGKASTLNPVVAHSKANQMASEVFSAVLFNRVRGSHRRVGREKGGAEKKTTHARRKAIGIATDSQLNAR